MEPTKTKVPAAPNVDTINIQVASDLHMELDARYDVDLINSEIVEYLILAGDIGSLGRQNHHRPFRKWLIGICARYKKVFYIMGNNECKGTTLEQGYDVLRQWEKDKEFQGRLKFLENERYDFDDEGHDVTILGCTLWTSLHPERDEENVTTEPWDDKYITDNNPKSHHKRHHESKAWLKAELRKVRKEKGKKQRIVVVTHHAPMLTCTSAQTYSSPNKYANDIIGGEGINDLGVKDMENFWVFGHTHYSCFFKQDHIRLYANQRGGTRQEEDEKEHGGKSKSHWTANAYISV